MINCEIINNPAKGTLRILERRVMDPEIKKMIQENKIESLALVQDKVSKIIALADDAEKTAAVLTAEVTGACPQHLTTILIVGSTSAVQMVVERFRRMSHMK